MKTKIVIKKPTKRVYGNEYPVSYYRNGKLVHKSHLFGHDLKYVKQSYTKEFMKAKVIRSYRKKRKRK